MLQTFGNLTLGHARIQHKAEQSCFQDEEEGDWSVRLVSC